MTMSTDATFQLHPQLAADTTCLGHYPLSDVLLCREGQLPWIILVPRQMGIREIYELSDADQIQLLRESSAVSRVINALYQPDKLNIAAIGNMVPQLHLHHVGRFSSDPVWPAPIWGRLTASWRSEEQQQAEMRKLQQALTDTADFIAA
ncbi:HIT family protein [Plesiomonas shigelloides]|uniref:HIT family protein n=1 Tax=Plesiomonas shigelloides TaxID=703 RepID=UPI00057B159A|nr:HIT domain-containing protein [Plesiomonas shigelloides]